MKRTVQYFGLIVFAGALAGCEGMPTPEPQPLTPPPVVHKAKLVHQAQGEASAVPPQELDGEGGGPIVCPSPNDCQ